MKSKKGSALIWILIILILLIAVGIGVYFWLEYNSIPQPPAFPE